MTAYLQEKFNKFYFGVFFVSCILMTLQILQSRIFSVTTWYHLSFLVISIAMFGMTSGALKVYKGDEAFQRANFSNLMSTACRKFGVRIFVALLAQMYIPLFSNTAPLFLVTLPIMAWLTVGAYHYAGIVLSLAITRAPYPVNRTYGIDLLGAAGGCLFALAVMKLIDTPSAVMLLVLLSFLCAYCFEDKSNPDTSEEGRKSLKWQKILLVPVGLLLLLNLTMPRPVIFPLWIKSAMINEFEFGYDKWNPISRVTVSTERTTDKPYLWGPSPLLPENLTVPHFRLRIDGDAETPINKFTLGQTDLSFLDYDVTTIAYALPGLDSAAIIGVGGGRDALSAHHAGVKSITAMDVNDIQISLLTKVEPYHSYAGLDKIDGLHLIHSEARSWFSRTKDKFDIIQMSLIDTWAATGAGAFALSENGLYTVEGWKIFLSHLKPHGVMTVSRWYYSDARSETERVLSLAVGSLLDLGATHPADHIYMATSGRIATFVVGIDPLTPEQIDALDARAKKMEFTTIISPRNPPTDGQWLAISKAASRAELQQISDAYEFDISPSTDHRPFFFNQVRITDPAHVFRMIVENTRSAQLGHARAILNLYLILAVALVMVSTIILYPLRGALRNGAPRLIFSGTVWFLLIGLGFMFIEIALVQRMGLYLGHPTYGLGVVLFSLILSTGLGSLASGAISLTTTGRRLIWIAITVLAVFAEMTAIDISVVRFADAGLLFRAVLCIALAMPMGFLLGFGFPTGMNLITASGDSRPTPWFWGINGAAGVLGSALAIALNISFGLNVTMGIGAVCYGLLALPTLLLAGTAKSA